MLSEIGSQIVKKLFSQPITSIITTITGILIQRFLLSHM